MADVFQSMLAGLAATGMTTTDIARQAGLSRQTLYRLENGEARAPSFSTYERLDRVYRANVPADVKLVNTRRL